MLIQENHKSRLLSTLNKYAEITTNEFRKMEPLLHGMEIKKGGHFIRQQESSYKYGFVIKGIFRAYYLNKGVERTIYFREENRFLSSYSAILKKQGSIYGIQAIEDSEILTFSLKDYAILENDNSCWTKMVNAYLSQIYLEREEREKTLLCYDAKERYEIFKKNHIKIIERIPQYIIASYLGITPVALSRIRNKTP